MSCFSDCCRLCLCKSKWLVNFNSKKAKKDLSYFEKIKLLIPNLKWYVSEQFPQKICKKCIAQLNAAFKFRQTCLKSQEQLFACSDQLQTNDANELCDSNESKTLSTELVDVNKCDDSNTKRSNVQKKCDLESNVPKIKVEKFNEALLANNQTKNSDINEEMLNNSVPLVKNDAVMDFETVDESNNCLTILNQNQPESKTETNQDVKLMHDGNISPEKQIDVETVQESKNLLTHQLFTDTDDEIDVETVDEVPKTVISDTANRRRMIEHYLLKNKILDEKRLCFMSLFIKAKRERKYRQILKVAHKELQKELPRFANSPKTPLLLVMQEAVEYCGQLQEQCSKNEMEKIQLGEHQEMLKQRLASLKRNDH